MNPPSSVKDVVQKVAGIFTRSQRLKEVTVVFLDYLGGKIHNQGSQCQRIFAGQLTTSVSMFVINLV